MPLSAKHLCAPVVCLFWLGCHAPTLSPSPPSSGSPPLTTCAAVREGNRPHLQLLRTFHEESKKQFGPNSQSAATLRALDFCAETPAGAWALRFDSLRREPAAVGVAGRWVISHLARDGSHTAVAPALPDGQTGELTATPDNFLDVTGNAHLTVEPPQLYDYDGDGEPEIIVQTIGHIHEGGDWRRGRIWTLGQGGVALYPPAAHINLRDVQDVDHDGRPDLLTVGPFVNTAEAPGSPYELTGPQLVAHARADGGFSWDDDVARAAAQKVCPKPPKDLVSKRQEQGLGEVIDCQTTAINITCSRLWGVSAVALRAQIERECPDTANATLLCNKETLLRFAITARPPLTLHGTAGALK